MVPSQRTAARWLSGLALAVGALGCSPPAERPVEIGPTPPAIAPKPAEAEPTASPAAPLPGSLAELGRPCPEPLPESLRCGTTGRVSGVYADAYAYLALPPGAESLYERHSSDDQRSAVLVSFDGPTVWLQLLQCGGCRKLVGWSFVGYPADLTDAQLQEVATRAGLPAGPPLRSRVEWAEASWDVAFEALPKGMDAPAPAAPTPGAAAPPAPAEPAAKPAKTKPAPAEAPKPGAAAAPDPY